MTYPAHDPKVSQFVRLLAQHERRVYGYILALVGNFADADDLQQEVNVRLWESFDRFEPGTDFGAWACTVARYQVMAFLKATAGAKVRCSQAVIDRIADELATASASESVDDRAIALEQCLREVSPFNQKLLRRVYGHAEPIHAIGKELGKSSDALYKAVQRARRFLFDCVRARMSDRRAGT